VTKFGRVVYGTGTVELGGVSYTAKSVAGFLGRNVSRGYAQRNVGAATRRPPPTGAADVVPSLVPHQWPPPPHAPWLYAKAAAATNSTANTPAAVNYLFMKTPHTPTIKNRLTKGEYRVALPTVPRRPSDLLPPPGLRGLEV
jgi:hypothetical protein